MTLVEILVAMGVLAVGMMGICALIPLAIRNTGVSVNKTQAASEAKSVMESLRRDSFSLGTTGSDSKVRSSLPASSGNLRIPEDVKPGKLPARLANPSATPARYMVCTWDKALGWTATLVPAIPGSGPNCRTFRAQVAVWHEWKLRSDLDVSNQDVKVHPTGALWIKSLGNDWEKINDGDYVRVLNTGTDSDGVWFLIEEVKKKSSWVELHLAGDGLPTGAIPPATDVKVEIASQNRLMCLYDRRLEMPADDGT